MSHQCGSHSGSGGCAGHLHETGSHRTAFRAQLPAGHPIATFMDEHVDILRHLDRLEVLARELTAGKAAADGPARRDALAEMAQIGRHLVGAEPHHQREEQVLFPAVIARGLEGPPHVMTLEHVELRQLKHAVEENATKGDVARATSAARGLVDMLRAHIAKEDEILYPMAYDVIPASEWPALRARCDAIGYCCGKHGATH